MDRLDAMQVILAVVDAGSLSAASRALNAPLPSVSRKVAELEQRLGTRLLIRTSRKIQLTDAGRDYVDAVRLIVAQIGEAERRASGEYHKPRGELTITVPVEFGRLLVLPLAIQFLEDHPEISLNFLSVDRLVNLVDEHVDIGVRLGNLADSSLIAVKVGEVTPLTCASPDYLARKGRPTSPEELAEHDGVIFGYLNDGRWRYEANGMSFEGKPRPRMQVNSAIAAVTAAVNGLGVTRVLNFQVADALRSGALVRVLEDYQTPTMPVHLIYVRQGLLPLKVRAFLDWATPKLRQTLTEFDGLCQPRMRANRRRPS